MVAARLLNTQYVAKKNPCPFSGLYPRRSQSFVVPERRGDEGGEHRVRRVAAIEPELAGIFPDHAVDRVRVHAPALVLALAVVLERPEQRPVDVGAVPRGLQIGARSRHCLRVDRERIATAGRRHRSAILAVSVSAGRQASRPPKGLAMMKTAALWLVTAACVAIVWAAPAHASPREEAEIRALLAGWARTFHEKNLPGVMSIHQRGSGLVAYDIVPPLQYKGWDAYRADYQAFFDQYEGARSRSRSEALLSLRARRSALATAWSGSAGF
jgi:hypothetical protein